MLHPLQQRIALLRSRIRRLLVLYALSWVASGIVATVAAVGLADWLFRFQDRGLRLMASLAVLAVTGWTGYRFLYRGLTARLGDLELALRLQRKFLQLGDGLASAVEFLGQSERDPTAGSPAMRRAVIHQTTAVAEGLDFRTALRPRPVWRAAALAAACLLAGAALVGLDPSGSRTALARLANPLGDVPWPQVHHLVLRNPVGPVHRGDTFRVGVVEADQDVRLPSEVFIYYRFENPDGPVVEKRKMDFVGGMMVAQRENVTRGFSFRVEGGDDRSMDWQPVEVVDPPAVKSLKTKLLPPTYTRRTPEYSEKDIRAIVGTRVEMTAVATKPLASAVLCLEGGTRVPGRLTRSDGSFQVPADAANGLVLEKSGTYWFDLTDVDGLSSEETPYGEIVALPDLPPTVTIDEPAGNLFATPQAEIPIRVTARDDLGIQTIELELSRSDQPGQPDAKKPLYSHPDAGQAQAGPPPGGDESGQRRTVVYRLCLAKEKPALAPGTQVTFWGVVTDHRPQTGKSTPRRLTIVTPEELLERIAERQSVVLAELSRVLAVQRQGREQVRASEILLQEKGRPDQSDADNLANAERNQRQVRHLLTSRSEGLPAHVLGLLADLENNKLDSPEIQRAMESLLSQIERLAREVLPTVDLELTAAIKAAQVRLEEQAASKDRAPPKPDAGPQPPAADIVKPLSAAGKQQDLVIQSLQRMRDELSRRDRFRGFYRDVAQLLREHEDLARRSIELSQRTRGEEMKDLPPETVAELRLAGSQQRELGRRLDAVQEQMDQAIGPLRTTDPLEGQTLADALARARQLNVGAAMQAAGGELEQNRISQATDHQQQIADHLRELLDILSDRRRPGRKPGQNETELAAEQMAQARQGIEGLRDRQQKALQEARRLEAAQQGSSQAERSLPPGDEPALEELTREQRRLEADTAALSRRLPGADDFRWALDAAAGDMGLAAARLDRQQIDRPTQEFQQNALARLASVLDALKPGPPSKKPDVKPSDQTGQPRGPRDVTRKVVSGAQDGQPKTKPGQEADKPGTGPAKTAAGQGPEGTAKRPAAARLRLALEHYWGTLPARQLEQMSQFPPAEEFLPKYEWLLEEYFKRLAEQPERQNAN